MHGVMEISKIRNSFNMIINAHNLCQMHACDVGNQINVCVCFHLSTLYCKSVFVKLFAENTKIPRENCLNITYQISN